MKRLPVGSVRWAEARREPTQPMSLFSATDPATPIARALVVTPAFTGLAADTRCLRSPNASLDEAVSLTRGIGVAVAHAEVMPLSEAPANSLFGRRGLERLGGMMEAFQADLLVVDAPLTPLQQRTVERACLVKVLDRCALILEALGTQADDQGARLQADLAAFQFQRGRLVRGWTHLPERGGLGFQPMGDGVPGEALLESHRRRLTERIALLKRELTDLRRARARGRAARKAAGIPTVALVGYAGSGVSALIHRLQERSHAGAGVQMAFSPVHAMDLVAGLPVLVDLPHSAVTAFAATLDAVRDADLILLAKDVRAPDGAVHARAVKAMLRQLGIDAKSDLRLLDVLTKADRLEGTARAALALGGFECHDGAVLVSAVSGMGMEDLVVRIGKRLDQRLGDQRQAAVPVLGRSGPPPD